MACRSNYGTIKMEMEALAANSARRSSARSGLRSEGGRSFWSTRQGCGQGRARSPHRKRPAGRVSRSSGRPRPRHLGWCSEEVRWPATPVVLANEEPLTMKGIIQTLAPRKPFFCPIPSRAVPGPACSAEILGLKLNFRSDSLVGLLHPISSQFLHQRAGIEARVLSERPLK